MKTTLKRGISRASANGNGHAVLPPSVLSPVTVYRQPVRRRSGWRLVGRIVLWLFAAIVMAAAGLAGGVVLLYDRAVSDVVATTPDLVRAQKQLDVALPGQPEIALVIGYDKRAGAEAGVTGNGDTVMLLRADPQKNAVSMISFPRDMVVTVKCPRKEFRGRINSAYAECGARGTLETVRAFTGLPVHYLITVNFRGFKQIVAKLGGVWLDVDRRYFNDRSGPGGYATIDLQPGYQKVNGSDALDFVRYRHFDSDIYRVARQQMFVKAARQRLASFDVFDAVALAKPLTQNIEVGRVGAGSIGDKIRSYALFAYRLPSGHFFPEKIDPNAFTGQFELSVPEEAVREALDDFANPDVAAPARATDAALGRKPRPLAGPKPSQVSVTVLNGNGVPGSANNAAAGLEKLGYQIVLPPSTQDGNAPSWDYQRSKAYYDPTVPIAQAAARKLADLFGDADVEPIPPEIAPRANGAMVVGVVGRTFDGSIGAEPAAETPPRQPPAVRSDPTEVLDHLRRAQRRVPFRVMVPTVLEHTSSAATFPPPQVPARVYEVEGHKALRLVFATGTSEHWGIQQTNWEDAPVLSEPNEKQRIAGRTYELHYNGSKLHMVVLRNGGATYWVVNTLLDSLSNETMIAIAKGLKPLPRR